MAEAAEVGKLVVRLLGDAASYQKMLRGASKGTEELKQKFTLLAQAERLRNQSIAAGLSITRSVEAATTKYSRELAELGKLLKRGHIDQKTYSKSVVKLEQDLQRGSGALAKIEAAERRKQQAFAAGLAVTRSMEKPLETYSRELKELKSLLKVGAISQDTFTRAVKKSQATYKATIPPLISLTSKIRMVGASMRTAGASMKSAGRSMSVAITAPLAIIGGLSVKAFANFDQAMTESTSIMKVTEEQIAAMRDTALSLSETGAVLQGPKDLAESYFFLASAGKSAEQSMALLPKVSAFATAGSFSLSLATDLLTDAQSALGLSSKNVAEDTMSLVRVSDVLVRANTLANASVQQFSTALTSKAGAALKAYDKDVEEGVAVLAALADQGVKAELAGNALDRVIRLATKGALDNADAHAALGFEVFDASGKMRNMADIIGNLETVLEGLSDKERAAALDALGFEARVQSVILPLLGTSKAIRKYEKELRKAGGTTKEVADKQMKSFSNQMKVFKNQLTVVAIEIGETLAPMLMKMTEFVKDGIKWWKALSPAVKKFAVIAGIVAAALGPVLIILGTVTTAIGFLLTPVVGIIAAVAGIAAGLVFLHVKFGIFDPFIAIAKAVWEGLKGIWDIIVLIKDIAIFPFVGAFGDFLPTLKDITSFASELKEAFIVIGEETTGFLADIREAAGFKEDLPQAEDAATQRGKIETLKLSQAGAAVREDKREKAVAESKRALLPPEERFGPVELSYFRLAQQELAQEAAMEKASIVRQKETVRLLTEQKKAIEEAVEESAKLVQDGESLLQTYEKQLAQLEMTNAERQIADLKARGLSDAEIDALTAAKDAVKHKQEELDLLKEAAKVREGQLSTEQKLAKELKAIDALSKKAIGEGGLDEEEIGKAKAAVEAEFAKLDQKTQLKVLSPRDAATIGSVEAERRLIEFRAGLPGGKEAIENSPAAKTEKNTGDIANFTEQAVELLTIIADKPVLEIEDSDVAGAA